MTQAKPKRTPPPAAGEMTLRDCFAAIALHVHLSHATPLAQAVELAYQCADEMLRQRDARN